MKKFNVIFALILIALIVFGYRTFSNKSSGDKDERNITYANNAKNATYTIEGKSVTLKDGSAVSEAAPGSASMITTKYFGNDVSYDFDNDGRMDTAFLITQSTGGSGVFYYAVVALNKQGGFVGSAASFIGDRIAPQTTEVTKDGVIVVNYAERGPNQSFAIAPSMGKTIRFKFDPKSNSLVTVPSESVGLQSHVQ